jgi:DNA-binding protein HU-beta
LGKNQEKPVEIGEFPLTLPGTKPHCNHRQGSSKPHEYRVFVHVDQVIAPPHAVRISRRKPVNNGSPKGSPTEGEHYMATGLTKTALTRQMAEKLEITNKQSAAFLDLLAETAIKETKKNGVFVIPGIGRLVKAERKARMGRNPQTGQAIKIKAKTVVKFRVAKSAKDTIAPPKK